MERDNQWRLAEPQAENQRAMVTQALGLHLERARTLSVDYSYWDETVAFVNAPVVDEAWAQDNLESALQTFGVDALWLFRLGPSQVIAVTGAESRDLAEPP